METVNPYASPYSVAQSPDNVRTAFYQKTYLHLAGAIGAFVILEALLLSIPGIKQTVFGILGTSNFSWLIVLGALHARLLGGRTSGPTSDTSQGHAVCRTRALPRRRGHHLPSRCLVIATYYTGQDGLVSDRPPSSPAGLFAGLTFVAFTTKKDFSFLGGMLKNRRIRRLSA